MTALQRKLSTFTSATPRPSMADSKARWWTDGFPALLQKGLSRTCRAASNALGAATQFVRVQPLFRRATTLKRGVRVSFELYGKHQRECPVCARISYFAGAGSPMRRDALCLRCGSLERHRQHLLLLRRHPDWIDGAKLLHFAPEPCFIADYRARASLYVPVDYRPRRGERHADIRQLAFATQSFDTIICHQVLEHVDDDAAAVRELHRVLRPGGHVVLSTPVVWTWATTYRNDAIATPSGRDLHFGQSDHTRYYGQDLLQMLASAGFSLERDIAQEPDVSRYGLLRGDVILVATKPAA